METRVIEYVVQASIVAFHTKWASCDFQSLEIHFKIVVSFAAVLKTQMQKKMFQVIPQHYWCQHISIRKQESYIIPTTPWTTIFSHVDRYPQIKKNMRAHMYTLF